MEEFFREISRRENGSFVLSNIICMYIAWYVKNEKRPPFARAPTTEKEEDPSEKVVNSNFKKTPFPSLWIKRTKNEEPLSHKWNFIYMMDDRLLAFFGRRIKAQ